MESNKILLPAAVIVAGLLIGGAVIWNGMRPEGGAPTVTVDSAEVKAEGVPFIGEENAPVVIALWTDYQCPFCKAVETGGIAQITTPPAVPDMIRDFVETGKAKILFKDYAFLGEHSLVAALWGRAVWNLYPEQYFAWRTAMYEAQDEEGDRGFGDEESIKELTAGIEGIDAEAVAADVAAKGDVYGAAIAADAEEARALGLSSTPSFVIGDQVIAGAYPYEAFKAAIEAALQ